MGFAVIGTFISLYFCQQWLDDGGIHPDRARLAVLCDAHIVRLDAGCFGGVKVAVVSLLVETAGLLLLWLADGTDSAGRRTAFTPGLGVH